MEITLNYLIYQSSEGNIYFDKEYFLAQKDIINQLLTETDYNLTVKRDGGNGSFFDKTDSLADAIKIIAKDIRNKNSVLNKLYEGVLSDELEIFANVVRYLTLGGWTNSNSKEYTTYFFPYYKSLVGFKFSCPNKYLTKKYQRELDIYSLDKEFILNNIVPAYYYDLGWWDRKSIRDNQEVMDYLSENWLSEDHSIAKLN